MEDKPKQNLSVLGVCYLGECVSFNRSININTLKLLSTVFVTSSEAKPGQQLLLLRVKPYRNRCSTVFSHLYSFKTRIGPCLVSHFEGKVGLHVDYTHWLNQPSEPPSVFCVDGDGVFRVLPKFQFVFSGSISCAVSKKHYSISLLRLSYCHVLLFYLKVVAF